MRFITKNKEAVTLLGFVGDQHLVQVKGICLKADGTMEAYRIQELRREILENGDNGRQSQGAQTPGDRNEVPEASDNGPKAPQDGQVNGNSASNPGVVLKKSELQDKGS